MKGWTRPARLLALAALIGAPLLNSPLPAQATAAHGAALYRLSAHPVEGSLFGHLNTASGLARRARPRLLLPSRGAITSQPRSTGVALLPAASPSPALSTTVAFPLDSFAQQVSVFGLGQALEPPDTQLAAGPSQLLELVNSVGSAWSKSGVLLAVADLNKVFPVPAGEQFSDPRVLYDQISGRWFMSGLSFNPFSGNSRVYVGVSHGSDLATGLQFYTFAGSTDGTIRDQPKIGTSDDKLVIGWNDFCCGALAPNFIGEETWVLQKSDLLAGAPVHMASLFGVDPSRQAPVPAQALESTTTAFVAHNESIDSGLIVITGTPLAGTVAEQETILATRPTSSPPPALQPAGTIATNDDRFLSAVWKGGMLWAVGNDSCRPPGDTVARSCLKLVRLSTGANPAIVQDFDAGVAGAYVYYPAVTQDGNGDSFFCFSFSTATSFASIGVAEQKVSGGPNTLQAALAFAAGQQTYHGGRWGDYSGAAPEPGSATQVWMTGEYAAMGSILNWGTATAEVSD